MATVIDFSAALPSVESLKKSGHEGVMLYCSPARQEWMRAKQPPKSYVDSLAKNGIKFAFVWQFRGGGSNPSNADTARGKAGGIEDAKLVSRYLHSIGRENLPVYFAVDFDVSLDYWNSTVSHYFRGAGEVLGRNRVGIYGHSRVVDWAREDNLVAGLGGGRVLGWVTKSWSQGGTGSDYAALYQGTHNVTGPDGIAVDINTVYSDNWGWKPIDSSPKKATPKMNIPAQYQKIRPNPNHRGDPVFLPEVLRAFGVSVKEMPGWRDWGMGDFDRIWGVAAHHTGSNNTSAEYIARNPGLENALSSQIHLSRQAPYTATICGAGVAWHLGRGSYPGLPTNNANPFMIGIEPQSNGTDPWPPGMLDVYYRIVAAILWYLGLDASRCIAHWEYSLVAQGKWDPGAGDGVSGHLMDMNKFRSHVQYYIQNPPFKQEEEDDLSSEFDKQYKSRYPGSNFKGSLRDYILNADAHAFASRVNTEKLLKLQEENNRLQKENNETNKELAKALNKLAEAYRDNN